MYHDPDADFLFCLVRHHRGRFGTGFGRPFMVSRIAWRTVSMVDHQNGRSVVAAEQTRVMRAWSQFEINTSSMW